MVLMELRWVEWVLIELCRVRFINLFWLDWKGFGEFCLGWVDFCKLDYVA